MALHLVHWQVVALHWLGRWDEAIVGAQRAKRAWEDLGRPAASYAVGCFLSAVAIARARHDTESFGTWADVIETILGGRVEPSRIESLSLALAREEFDLALEQFPLIQVSVLPTYVAHALGQFSDRNLLVPEHTLQAWADRAFTEGTPLVEAEARRGLALLHGEEAQAVRAIELFEQCSAKASTARVRCELGLLTGDENIFRAGAAILESLGDVDQLERFAARRP